MVDKRGLGGLGAEPKPKSRLPTFWEFINPLSLPPGETDRGLKGPTLRDVIVPPTTPGRPPGVAPQGWGNYLLDFINPFSEPPGAEPIRGDNPMGGPASFWQQEELERNRLAKQQPYVPLEWLPPHLRPALPPPQPTGPATPDNPDWYDPQAHPIPRAKRGRLNIKRRKSEA